MRLVSKRELAHVKNEIDRYLSEKAIKSREKRIAGEREMYRTNLDAIKDAMHVKCCNQSCLYIEHGDFVSDRFEEALAWRTEYSALSYIDKRSELFSMIYRNWDNVSETLTGYTFPGIGRVCS
jgi:hypothetical protein